MLYKVHKGVQIDYDKVQGHLLESILLNRGITDWQAFLNVSQKDILDPTLMINMTNGADLLIKHIENNSTIYTEVDEDVDGFCSNAILTNFLLDLKKEGKFNGEVIYNVKMGKKHGISLEHIDFDKVDLVIVPDAGSNDIKQCKQLQENKIDVLILDHHIIETLNPYAIVINCQDGQYPNPHLSGTNVTYKFLEYFCSLYYQEYPIEKFLSLVALGNIGDSMDLRSLETRQYTLMGLEQIREDRELVLKGLPIIGNNFIQAVVSKRGERDLKHINFTSVGWYIAPLINGMIRFGELEEKIDLFKAMLNLEEVRIYQPRRKSKNDPKPEPVEVTLADEMVRVCTNVKAKQDKTVKAGKDQLNEKIVDKGLSENKVLIVDATDILQDKTLTGLVANKLANDYKRPVVLLKYMGNGKYGGSARNYSLSPIEDFKDFLSELGTFDECLGHQGAFGFKIDQDNLIETRDIINEKLKHVEMDDTWIVEMILPLRRINKKDIISVGKWRDIWGNTVSEPLFCIQNVKVPVSDIKLLGERENIISFKANDITFIKFFTNREEYDKMIMRNSGGFAKAVKEVVLDIIVKFEVNEYEGQDYAQCVIVDYDVSKQTKKPLF